MPLMIFVFDEMTMQGPVLVAVDVERLWCGLV